MLVSHDRRFIYLKTKKTAGSSVEAALEPYALPAPRRHARRTPVVSHAGIVGVGNAGRGGREDGWFSHMSARRVRERLDPEIWDGYVKICNVRNPWDKVVSFFHMQFPAIKREPRGTVFAAFREWVSTARRMGQDSGIYCIDGAPVVDEVIRYGALQEDFSRVCRRLGLPQLALPRKAANTRGAEKIPYQDYYDAASRALVAKRFARDITLFGWTFEETLPARVPEPAAPAHAAAVAPAEEAVDKDPVS